MSQDTIYHAKYREVLAPTPEEFNNIAQIPRLTNKAMLVLGKVFFVGYSGSMEDCDYWAQKHIIEECPDYDYNALHEETTNTHSVYMCPLTIYDNGYQPWIIINDKS